MGNSYFQFKQFRIEQDRCGMKVSTDACVQGAWTPVSASVKNVLDIGAGTGLLSLMLAQRAPEVSIDALEIDPQAAKQASENAAASPWRERVSVRQVDARNLHTETKYDLIVCNPPFFSSSLLGSLAARNQARHALTLRLDELFELLRRNIAEGGYASVLLPVTEHQAWSRLLYSHNWSIFQSLHIRPRRDQEANRVVSLCIAGAAPACVTEDLAIRNHDQRYTSEFAHLLEPYYLML